MNFYYNGTTLYTVVAVPSFQYLTGANGGAQIAPPAGYYYDSGPICNSGAVTQANVQLYLQYGNAVPTASTFINTLTQGPLALNPITSITQTPVNTYGATPTAPLAGTAINATSVQFNVDTSILTDSRTSTMGVYAIAYLQVVYGNESYVAIIDYGAFKNSVATPPSQPTNLKIISTRSATATTYTDPDITLQWTQSIPGAAPIAGYKLFWGTSANALNNSRSFSISAYPIGTSATYTASLPGGTIPSPETPTPYYFDVEAYDDGTAVNSFVSLGSSRWLSSNWYPSITLGVCNFTAAPAISFTAISIDAIPWTNFQLWTAGDFLGEYGAMILGSQIPTLEAFAPSQELLVAWEAHIIANPGDPKN